MRVILAVAILTLLPAASAGEVTWDAPDEVRAGHPVFAAYAIENGDGTFEGHVDIEVQVLLDGHSLFSTASVHEHDGVHTLVVTPPAAGQLELVAIRDGAVAARHNVTVTPAADNATGFPGIDVTWDAAGAMARADVPSTRLLEFPDTQGRLMLGGWLVDGEGFGFRSRGDSDAPPRSWFLNHPEAVDDRGARLAHADAYDDSVLTVLTGFPDPPLEDCGPEVVLDPNTLAPEGHVWQAGSNVRVTNFVGDGPTTYSLLRPDGPVGDAVARDSVVFQARVEDPFGTLTFHPGMPGPAVLVVERGSVNCQVEMDFLPAPADGTGSVEASFEPTPNGQHITFTPYGVDGATLGHYEFDTRVLRMAEDDDPGRLVWSGKLHGHGGLVAFDVENLAPGTYQVVTYPSPQNPNVPTVAADGPEGFAYTFEVDEPPADADNIGLAPWLVDAEPAAEAESADREASAGLLLLPLIVALFLVCRG